VDDIVVQTTRGAVEAYAKRMAADFAELDGARPLAGFGFGKTLMRAHSEAHAALSFSGENGLLYSVFEGGVPRMRSTDPRMDASGVNALQQRAAQLRLSPMVLYRISNALKVLDHSAFSAEELAGAYGGSARTARRLISRLREAGVVTQTGSTRSPGAGRPVSMYAADINRLLSVGGADNE
jgi:hypothetical protein